jgi:hypothetical protein
MKIDTEIRHVTKPGANLFLELGLAPDEAKRLQAASRKQINDTLSEDRRWQGRGDRPACQEVRFVLHQRPSLTRQADGSLYC